MAVYVDWLMHHGWRLRGRYVQNCHLFGDSVEELIEFAQSIGMKPEWLQSKKAMHFDLTKSRRNEALAKGAVELDRTTWRAVYERAKQQSSEAIET